MSSAALVTRRGFGLGECGSATVDFGDDVLRGFVPAIAGLRLPTSPRSLEKNDPSSEEDISTSPLIIVAEMITIPSTRKLTAKIASLDPSPICPAR